MQAYAGKASMEAKRDMSVLGSGERVVPISIFVLYAVDAVPWRGDKAWY